MPRHALVIHVAVAIIFNKQGQLLISKRLQHQYAGGLWEFPGGKIEPNESVIDALKREILEELNLTILTAHPLIQVPYDYADRSVLLDVWQVDSYQGEPEGREGQPIRWVALNELSSYQFPAGNQAILNKIKEMANSFS